ncbi:hypothetical protein ABPG75_000509 [Micractinium tetrahymenae]
MVPPVAPASHCSAQEDSTVAQGLPPSGSVVGGADQAAHGGEHLELSLPHSLQRMPDSLKRIYLTANGSSRLSSSSKGGSTCGASWRSADDSAAALGAGAGGRGSSTDAASCGVSWHSAEDSAAVLGATTAAGKAVPEGGKACSGSGGSSSLSLYDDLEEDDPWDDDRPYGADAWQAPWRRTEGLPGCWLLVALLAALAINVGVGITNSRHAAARRHAMEPAKVAAAAATNPVLAPAAVLQPGPRKRRVPAATLPQPPPRPPRPPPAYCEVGGGAPANLARPRFSNLTAVFPAPPEHYAANLVDRKAGDAVTRYPAYYNGVVPRFCIVAVEAIYTCLSDDNPCNYSPEVSLRLCEGACPNSADSCQRVAGMAGHPLQIRLCGLFGLSKPSCINIGFTAARQRMMRAYYKLNVCQAPPGIRPPPRPPLPPLQSPSPPPPPVPVAYEYY